MLDSQIADIRRERRVFPSEAAHQAYLKRMQEQSGTSRWDAVDIVIMKARDLLKYVDRARNVALKSGYIGEPFKLRWTFTKSNGEPYDVEKEVPANKDLVVTILAPERSPTRVTLKVGTQFRENWLEGEIKRRAAIQEYVRQADLRASAAAASATERRRPIPGKWNLFAVLKVGGLSGIAVSASFANLISGLFVAALAYAAYRMFREYQHVRAQRLLLYPQRQQLRQSRFEFSA